DRRLLRGAADRARASVPGADPGALIRGNMHRCVPSCPPLTRMLIVIPDTLTIARRYCGPPTTGNGGYSAGLLGRYIDGPAQVTLRSPPPLERPLRLARENDKLLLRDGEQLVAEAVPTDFELDVPAAPSFEQAEAAVQRYVGFTERTFPTCFVCGPDREAGDGLRIFPGETGAGVVAAPR